MSATNLWRLLSLAALAVAAVIMAPVCTERECPPVDECVPEPHDEGEEP